MPVATRAQQAGAATPGQNRQFVSGGVKRLPASLTHPLSCSAVNGITSHARHEATRVYAYRVGCGGSASHQARARVAQSHLLVDTVTSQRLPSVVVPRES